MTRLTGNAVGTIMAALMCLCCPFVGQAQTSLEEAEEAAFKQAAALVSPSVVRIETVGGLDRVGRVLTSTGPTTGVVMSRDGFIISSAFNFLAKPSSVLVSLPDGRRFPAKVVATDHVRMLTLLQIEANDLVVPQIAPKDSYRVGQWAIALGRTYDSPLPNVSVGIVSALNRVWGKAIQTDAKISPVNYGGPLVDSSGRVLGVLVPLSPQGTDETAGVEWYDSGIGFAIPLPDVVDILDRLKSGDDLKPGLMGVTLAGSDLYAPDPSIDRVRYDSPAQKAGIEAGDVIVEVDGQRVSRMAHLKQLMGTQYAGDEVQLVVRRGEESIKTRLTLVAELKPYEPAFLGILPLREKLGAAELVGAGVRHVYPDSPAAKAGLQPRDRIIRLNNTDVADSASLREQVSRIRSGEPASVVFLRGEQETTAEVELVSIPNDVLADISSVAIPSPAEDLADKPKTGRFTENLPANEQSYWAYVPDDYNPDYPYTLMVWLHPQNDTMEAAIFKQWRPICDRRGIIIVAPKAEDLSGWSPNEAEFVKDAVDHIRQTYTVDPARIFVHGYDDGGQFAFHAAFKFRELFRGIAAVAAPLRARPPENLPDTPLQVHLVCGDQDSLYRLVSATATGLLRMKFPTSFTTIKEGDHQYPPAEQIEEIGRWADALDRI